jgi:hypothetical protein
MATVSERPGVIPFRYSSLSLAYTVCATIVFLFAPLGTSESSGSNQAKHVAHVSLWQLNGWRILVVLGLPVVFAAVPVIRRRSRHVRTLLAASAVLLTTYVVLGILTIGLYYAPSAGLMIAAAFRERPTPRGRATGYRTEPDASPSPPPPSLNGHGAQT